MVIGTDHLTMGIVSLSFDTLLIKRIEHEWISLSSQMLRQMKVTSLSVYVNFLFWIYFSKVDLI